jgi:D-alanyl-D-alanine dipeptidase
MMSPARAQVTTQPALATGVANRLEGHYSDGRGNIDLKFVEDRLYAELPDRADEVVMCGAAICLKTATSAQVDPQGRAIRYNDRSYFRVDWPEPATPSPTIAAMIGFYGEGDRAVTVFEKGGQLYITDTKRGYSLLTKQSPLQWALPNGQPVRTGKDAQGRVTGINVGGVDRPRQALPVTAATALSPAERVARVERLRDEALKASPPVETGKLVSDLISVTTIDPTIKLDIRYAGTNSFLGAPVYRYVVAMAQRPTAEALGRVNRALRSRGYGLIIFDAYRPWYVTKLFWDQAALKDRPFVADPAEGSRHNRGSAIDLSLYQLSTGQPVDMPGGYDENTARSSPTFVGGTSHQRWLRDMLHAAMRAEDFEVDGIEWWHFNHAGWDRYPLGNVEIAAQP